VPLTCGTRLFPAVSQRWNPGTFSVISPPPAEVRGPQQGAASAPLPAAGEQPPAGCSLGGDDLTVMFLNCLVFMPCSF